MGGDASPDGAARPDEDGEAALGPEDEDSEVSDEDSDVAEGEQPSEVRRARRAVQRLRHLGAAPARSRFAFFWSVCRASESQQVVASFRPGADVSLFSGGPVHRNDPLGLLILKRGADAGAAPDSAALRAAAGDVAPWAPLDATQGTADRAYVGAVPSLANAASLFVDAGWTCECLCFSGIAIWSTDQLLAEISRGSWVLTRATWDDVAAAPRPGDLWEDVVVDRECVGAPELAEVSLLAS